MVAAVKRGEPVPSAAQRLGVMTSTAYTWLHRSKDSGEAPSRPTFIELVTAGPPSPSLVIRVGVVEIEVRAGFDAGLLRAVVAALDGGAA